MGVSFNENDYYNDYFYHFLSFIYNVLKVRQIAVACRQKKAPACRSFLYFLFGNQERILHF
jgi:CRISPR/Cas system endoribonuclease Cas6 (RAMP superfamily)